MSMSSSIQPLSSTMNAAVVRPLVAIQAASSAPGVASSPIPQSYAALVRAVLRYRQKRVYGLAFAAVACGIPLAAFPVAGFDVLVAWLLPTVWLYLALGWTSTLPIFIARKQFLTTSHSTAPDRFSMYQAQLLSQQARFSILAYILAGSIFIVSFTLYISHLVVAKSYMPFTRTPGRDVFMLNERFVYLSLAVLISSITYGVRQVAASRNILRFQPGNRSIPSRLQARLAATTATTASIAVSCNITLLALYLLFKRSVLRFIIYRIPGGRLLRPYLLSMLRVNNVSASLILSSLCASVVLLLVLELSNTLADVYYTQPISVSSFSREPQRSLLEGLKSPDLFIRRFAYTELQQVVLTEQVRRAAIFTDIKDKSFELTSRVALVQLGRSYRNLQRRGKANVPRIEERGQAASNRAVNQPNPTQLPIAKQPAFLPFKPTLLDTVTSALSPSAQQQRLPQAALRTSNAAVQTVQSLAVASTSALADVPDLFRRKVQSIVPVQAVEAVQAAEKAAGDTFQAVQQAEATILQRWRRFTPTALLNLSLIKSLSAPLLAATTARCLPDADIDACAVAALGALVMASLHEDKYGVAQGDIPKILEAFVLYYDELQRYIAETTRQASESKLDERVVKEELARGVEPLVSVLRENMLGILQTFSAYLQDIRFPAQVAKRLQDFT